ncbi:MAG: hypothetical protein HGN29_08670 [Asgard group archaeon]|nr:hypothetical protein [Asgard group archaeon]
MKTKKCREHKHECGKFTGGESREEKLKHLKECKQGLRSQIEKIDKAIKDLD